ncbi:dihydrofolate reductase family protein [Microbacterium sp.]|uniref:dihydrofolate reductase family protein n=1 Tax=Microbacterium sp. TaxID=51671 RepID=UPI003340CADB
MTTRYYTASSIDGFIATPQHSLDWLLHQDVDPDGPMGYNAFIQGVGAIAMGASTFDWVIDNAGTWDYTQPAWVFTHRERIAPEGADVRFTSAEATTVHAEMSAAAGGEDLWIVGGGDLAGQFADAGLLDEVWVQYAPVTLGAGAPLFPREYDLELIDVARNRAFVCARYAVGGPREPQG